jgi:hypothetical protein
MIDLLVSMILVWRELYALVHFYRLFGLARLFDQRTSRPIGGRE